MTVRSGPSPAVCCGSKTEVTALKADSVVTPATDIGRPWRHVRFVPTAQTASHRQRNFADKPFFAPVKANFPLLLGNHLFDDTGAESRSCRFLRDWTTRLHPAQL